MNIDQRKLASLHWDEDGPEPVCPALDNAAQFKAWFEAQGYIVLRGALPAAACEAARQGFLREVYLDTEAFFPRHTSGTHERHVYTDHGFMKYPIVNLQDISDRRYPQFRQHGLALLTHPVAQRALAILLGQPGRVVHTMYFDGNHGSWAQRIGRYADAGAGHDGPMIGAWIAAEDIHPDAGRFFVLPRSHQIAVPGEHERLPEAGDYQTLMTNFVAHGPLRRVAPVLRQGDMLLWNLMLIHGSLAAVNPAYSRRSFSGHYIACPDQIKRHASSRGGTASMFNGMEILHHCDRHSMLGKAAHLVRSEHPALYALVRRLQGLLTPR